jgi:hypothetical protein
MAVIPNVTRIQRASPTDRSIVVGSPSEPIPAAAQQVAADINAAQQRKTQFQGAMADSRFRSASINLSDDFDRDEDYNTMPDRYEKKARERLGEIADSIGDPRAKAMFLEGQEAVVQAGIVRIKDKAFGIEKDFMRADVDEQLLAEEDNVISGDAEAVDRAMLIIDGGAGADYLTAEEAQSAKTTFKTNSAVKWLESIDPTKRLAALKEPLADNLPPDVRAKMTREAEVAQRSSVAQAEVDTLMANDGMDRIMGLEEIAKIQDVALRDETQRRFDYALNARDRAFDEYSVATHDQYFNSVLSGDQLVDDIPKEELEGLKPAQLTNLYAAQAASVKPVTRSNPSVIDQLHVLEARKDLAGLRDYFLENSASLTAADYNTWSGLSTKGAAPIEYKSLIVKSQLLKSKLDTANVGKNDQSVYLEKLRDWHNSYWETNQKLPTDRDVEEKMDRLLIDTSDAPGFGSSRVFEMNQSELSETIDNMRDDRPDIFADVLSTFSDPSKVPPDEFIQAYEARLNAQ